MPDEDQTTPPPAAAPGARAPVPLLPEDWRILIDAIDSGRCTPFIGAGASVPYIETGTAIARRWAAEEKYPFTDAHDLARVAQYVTLSPKLGHPALAKERMVEYISQRRAPNFDAPNEPYRLLADLPLPIFITTNYDRFVSDALARTEVVDPATGTKAFKQPRVEWCEWNAELRDQRRQNQRRQKERGARHDRRGEPHPTIATPLVYHLHGVVDEPNSLVLTEDDYVDFIVNASLSNFDIVPSSIQAAMTVNSLLFLGYSLNDWNFKVLFRTFQHLITRRSRPPHVAVQLKPEGLTADQEERVLRFADKYFEKINIILIRCDVRDFLTELAEQRRAHV